MSLFHQSQTRFLRSAFEPALSRFYAASALSRRLYSSPEREEGTKSETARLQTVGRNSWNLQKRNVDRPVFRPWHFLIKLTDEEFAELYSVFKNMPALKLDVDVKVEDDDLENKITAGSIVTISTKLIRQCMEDITNAADAGEVNLTTEM